MTLCQASLWVFLNYAASDEGLRPSIQMLNASKGSLPFSWWYGTVGSLQSRALIPKVSGSLHGKQGSHGVTETLDSAFFVRQANLRVFQAGMASCSPRHGLDCRERMRLTQPGSMEPCPAAKPSGQGHWGAWPWNALMMLLET